MRKPFSKKQTEKIMNFTLNGKSIVHELWYEQDCGEVSVWIALKDGYNWDGCSCVHESSFRDALSSLAWVKEGEPY